MNSFNSLMNSFKQWFGDEKNEAKKARQDVEQRLEDDLTRRERGLTATPEQKLENIQEEIDDDDDAFDQIKEKLAKADAKNELDDSAES